MEQVGVESFEKALNIFNNGVFESVCAGAAFIACMVIGFSVFKNIGMKLNDEYSAGLKGGVGCLVVTPIVTLGSGLISYGVYELMKYLVH